MPQLGFSRAWRLVERLFPGLTEYPDRIDKVVQPVWNVNELRIGDAILRAEHQATAVGTGVDATCTFSTPDSKRIHVPISLCGGHDSTTLTQKAQVFINPTAGVTGDEVWGRWSSSLNIVLDGQPVPPYSLIRFHVLPFYTKGSNIVVNYRVLDVGVTAGVDYLYLDCPAEMVAIFAGGSHGH